MSYILPANGPRTVILADNRDPWVSWANHLKRGSLGGVDVVAPVGTPVYAPADGTVTNYEWNGSGGHTVSLYQAGGWKDHFMHLSRFAVGNGATVKQGQLIGYTGRTANGSLTGVAPHLHWHRIDAQGIRRNPWDYFGKTGSAGGTGGGVLGYGLTADAQRATQEALQKLGLYSGQVDGVFGALSVTAFQKHLKNIGLLPGNYEPDGVPGEVYGRAIQELAAKHGYTGKVDGVPGAATSAAIVTWARTITAPAPAVPAEKPPVGDAWGLSADAQRAAQGALSRLGLYSGTIDGVFGNLSVQAFQQYLKNAGLLPADYKTDGIPGLTYGEAIQRLAARHGYTGAFDGKPGAATSKAIVVWGDSVLPVVTQPEPTTPTKPVPEKPLPGSWGIDVATSQAGIDFAQAKAGGVQFAVVKFGGANVLPIYEAPYYKKQIDAAKYVGLPVGHYYVTGKGDAVEQADFFVSNLYRFDKNTDIIALDNEYFSTGNPNSEFWDDAKAASFIRRVIERTGIDPRRVYLYGYASALRGQKWDAVQALGVRLWWAAYGGSPSGKVPDHTPELGGAFPDWHIHQYTSSAVVPGNGTPMDANYSRLTVDEIFNIPAPTPDEPQVPAEPTKGSNAWVVGLLNVIAAAVAALLGWFSTQN